MPTQGIGGQTPVQTQTIDQTQGPQEVGNGLGGHTAQVGNARGRGIGTMIGNAFRAAGRAISSFFARIGNLITGRNRQTQETAQARDIQQPPPAQPSVQDMATLFENQVQEGCGMLDTNSLQGYNQGRIETMADDGDVQTFIETHLDDPDFSSDTFTGIDDHPPESPTFTARFGNNELVLSNRSSSNFEFRGTQLKEALQDNFSNLRELIQRGHLTKNDTMLMVAVAPALGTLQSQMGHLSSGERSELKDAIAPLPVGNTTIGELRDLSFLD
ncbi:MAG: hypothetical protein MI747_15950 [Desulfobacterales bacterium]|nr:hypothetical protein [Desulfobacterales bacterium]